MSRRWQKSQERDLSSLASRYNEDTGLKKKEKREKRDRSYLEHIHSRVSGDLFNNG